MTVATTGCDTVFHFGYGQGVRGNIRRTYCTRKQTFVRGADPQVVALDRDESRASQENAAIDPRHLIDHEAAAWIREIASPLSDPNQSYQNGDNTEDQQRNSYEWLRAFLISNDCILPRPIVSLLAVARQLVEILFSARFCHRIERTNCSPVPVCKPPFFRCFLLLSSVSPGRQGWLMK